MRKYLLCITIALCFILFVYAFQTRYTFNRNIDNSSSVIADNKDIAIEIPLAPVSIAENPVLIEADTHYTKHCSDYIEKYSMIFSPYKLFNESQANFTYVTFFYGYVLGHVFTNVKNSSSLPQIQIHGYMGYDERLQIKIVKYNNRIRDYYHDYDITEIEVKDRLFYFVKSTDEIELISFKYDTFLIEIGFDCISFSENSIRPLLLKKKRIHDIDNLLECISNSVLFSDETLRKYTAFINEYC